MRVYKSAALVLAAGAALVASGFRHQQAAETMAPSDTAQNYTVHEWGTFTSVSGSDGVLLPGLQVEEELLPDFVHSHEGMGNVGGKGWLRSLQNVTVKMETPVLYFYSDVPRHVKVDVGFRGGSISQWYPERAGGEVPPARASASSNDAEGSIDFAAGYNGAIAWDVDVLAPGPRPEWEIFRGTETRSWISPRRPESNVVQTASGEREKFLFYRGVGRFEPPVRLSVSADATLTLENRGTDRIPFLMVFDNRGLDGDSGVPTGSQGSSRWPVRVASYAMDGLEPGAIQRLELGSLKATDDWRAGMYERMWRALVDAGLSGDEADAMLQTWWESYFETEGLRVFWIVPRAFVDAVLPLTLDPPPTALSRVLVGRSEVLTPAFEETLATEFKADPDARSWDRYGEAYRARMESMEAAEAAR